MKSKTLIYPILWIFLLLTLWNFTFPPRAEKAYPDHMADTADRAFYYSKDFHKQYSPHPDYPDSSVRKFDAAFIVHWEKVIITQCLLTLAFIFTGSLITFANQHRNKTSSDFT